MCRDGGMEVGTVYINIYICIVSYALVIFETVTPGGHICRLPGPKTSKVDLASLARGGTVLDRDVLSGQGFTNPKTSQELTVNVAPRSTFVTRILHYSSL